MARKAKRMEKVYAELDRTAPVKLEEAVKELKARHSVKFDETVEIAMNLGLDPRHADQTLRGAVTLPHGTGKTVRVAAFAQGDKAREAEEAGADIVGGADLIERVAGGWMEFDAAVATPDMMGQVGSKLGRVLGPRGLLPNPKAGTVGMNIGEIVSALKAGQIEFRADKTGVVHAPIGKSSFPPDQLEENLEALRRAVEAAKPDSAKGQYLRTLYLSSTMGPSVRVAL